MNQEKSTTEKFAEMGRKGGKKTAKKYGKDYMREISRRGVAVRLENLKKRYGANKQQDKASVPNGRRVRVSSARGA